MADSSAESDTYYPPPESEGGWRYIIEPEGVGAIARMDPEKLGLVQQMQDFWYGGDSWGVVIIRNGYLVREFYTLNVLASTRFDIWSGTKAFTSTAWGLLVEDSRQNRLPYGQQVNLGSPTYTFIPDGYPLTDPRKERITIRHLLTMTSGIPGESVGVIGMATATGCGPFEYALGRYPNRYGKRVDKLLAEPGTRWDYSDPAYAHLSLAFANIMGREMSDYLQERIFDPIGIENLSWDVQGGSGFIGPHTNAHTGIHISARELARFGYLILNKGVWKGRQVIPRWWIDLATKASQDLNPLYGYAWLLNTGGERWRGLPEDMFALAGYRSIRCYIIPSLDLIVARVGSGPPDWEETRLIGEIVTTIQVARGVTQG